MFVSWLYKLKISIRFAGWKIAKTLVIGLLAIAPIVVNR